MAVLNKTKLAALAAEAAADLGTAPVGKRKTQPVDVPAITPEPEKPTGPAYRLADFKYSEFEGGCDWTATLMLGSNASAGVVWAGAKRVATLKPLAKTTGAADEVAVFEAAAARLLGSRTATQDLIRVLIMTSEPGITAFNRIALLSDIPRSAAIASRPDLITAV